MVELVASGLGLWQKDSPDLMQGRTKSMVVTRLHPRLAIRRGRQTVSRWTHNPEKAGSTPAPATKFFCTYALKGAPLARGARTLDSVGVVKFLENFHRIALRGFESLRQGVAARELPLFLTKLDMCDCEKKTEPCEEPCEERKFKVGTFFDRLLFEKKELDEKIGDLVSFLHNGDRCKITVAQETLLELQLGHMKNYASCLNLRIAEIRSKMNP